MRILSVKFKNLNSLRGEHQIDFNSPPFSESGLFAITGPTGSGKTTILDAITVALYGKVHRHTNHVEEIMTRHTGECYSEVEFESKGIVYRTKWSLSRARGKADGKMQSERMELAEFRDDQFVMIGEHTPTLIKRQIEELCGLDYAQFLRSVILSQGDFTRFLKSTDRERSELLENITGTEVYSEISMFVFKKEKEERDALIALRQKLGDVNLLSDEEKSGYAQQLSALGTKELTFRESQKATLANLSWIEGIQKLENRKLTLEAELAGLEQKFLAHGEDFEKLKWHQSADKYNAQYLGWKGLLEEETILKDKIGVIALQIPALEAKLSEAITQRKLVNDKLNEAEKKQELLNPVIDQALQKDEEIKSLNKVLLTIFVEINTIQPVITNLNTQKDNLGIRLRDLNKEILTLQNQLSENQIDAALDKQLLIFNQHAGKLRELRTTIQKEDLELLEDQRILTKGKAEVIGINQAVEAAKLAVETLEKDIQALAAKAQHALQGKSLETLEAYANSLPVLISSYQLLYESAEAIKKTRQEYLNLKGITTDLDKQLNLKSSSLAKLKAAHESAKKLLDLHQRLVDLEQRIQNYEADRQKLREGEPCALCGSTHHPFATNVHKHQLSEAQQQLAAQQLQVESLTKQILDLTVEVERIQANIDNFNQQLTEKAAAGQEIKLKFQQLNDLVSDAMNVDHPDQIKLVLEETKDRWILEKERLQHIRQLKEQLTESQTKAEENKKHILTLQGKSGILTENLRGIRERMNRNGLTTQDLRAKEKEETASLEQMLLPFGLNLESGNLEFIIKALSLRNERYIATTNTLLAKQEDQIRLNKSLDPLLFQLEEQQRLLKKAGEQADRMNKDLEIKKEERLRLFGSRDPIHERNRIAAEIKNLVQLKEAAEKGLQSAEKLLSETVFELKQQRELLNGLLSKKDRMHEELTRLLMLEGIAGIEALSALLLPEEMAQQLAELKRQLDEGMSTTKGFIKQNVAELEQEQLKQLTASDYTTLKLLLADINTDLSNLNQEIGRLKGVLDADVKLGLQHQNLSRQIKLQQAVQSKWSNLNALIGAADGQKFRLFAQGLTLARLTELANKHLKQLTDRYTILKGKEDLLLLIEDGYQAGAVRPMATLSGGESFLVSLALALGLSDLASHKVQINSLFIDEGFGTLDADTLDVAISALENLQSKGKTIGIISHVEALKERIGTQVQIIKQPGGSSKIRIQDYGKTVLGEFLN